MGHQGFTALFRGKLRLLQFRGCNVLHMEKTVGLNSVVECARKCDEENDGGGVRASQWIGVS